MSKCPKCEMDLSDNGTILVDYHVDAHLFGYPRLMEDHIITEDVEPCCDNLYDEDIHPIIRAPIYYCSNCCHEFTEAETIAILKERDAKAAS